MKYLYLSLALIAGFLTTTARAETINCTEITVIPMVITVQGVYCLKGNLATSLTVGNMIDIQTNNVTIDFNGFKLGGLAAGPGTLATGIFARDRKNITLRNGSVRGFFKGIYLDKSGTGISSGHLIEDMLLDGNKAVGIQAEGSGMIVRRNRVVNSGPTNNNSNVTGIFMRTASNSVIADNLVSGTSGTDFARGIVVTSSTLIEVRGNTILDARDATGKQGIFLAGTIDITVSGNRILNAAGTGDNGIIGDPVFSTGLNCIGNTVAGFTTALSGCDFAAGNNLAP